MMGNFDTFNTMSVSAGDALHAAMQAERDRDFSPTVQGLTVGLSSGTSGHRGLFLVSAREQAAWAGIMLARVLHGSLFQVVRRLADHLRVAFFLRANSNLYESTGRFLEFRYFDLMTPIDEAIAELNQYQPKVLIAPPSLLGLLGKQRRLGWLNISPEQIISVAEVLEPQDQLALESEFGIPIHQIYQCTEGLIGVSCQAGRLHLQEDLIAVQMVPVDPGDPRRVSPVVTDLWRQAQPIIRYKLNDIWQLDSSPCKCGSGFRVIKSVEGRSDDLCYFSGRPVFPDSIRKMILLASDSILDYEATQEKSGQLTIRLEVQPGVDFTAVAADVRKSVKTVLNSYRCQADSLVVEEGIAPREPSAKRRRVRNVAQG